MHTYSKISTCRGKIVIISIILWVEAKISTTVMRWLLVKQCATGRRGKKGAGARAQSGKGAFVSMCADGEELVGIYHAEGVIERLINHG